MNNSPANDAGSGGDASSSDAGSSEVRLEGDVEGLMAKIAKLEAKIDELELLAHIDPLVRLPNRRSIFRDLERLIANLNRSEGHAAIIFVDVDALKKINDRYGHLVGDAALIKIAQTLVGTVRKSDIVGRLSGDEFVILLPGTDELGAWTMALRVAESMMASPLITDLYQVELSVAVGVTTVGPYDRPNDVILRADQAMYRIKSV